MHGFSILYLLILRAIVHDTGSQARPGTRGGDFNYLYPYFHDLVIKVKNESSLKFYFYIFGEKKNKSFPKDGN